MADSTENLKAAATEATAKMTSAAEETLEKSKEMFTKSTKTAEKVAEGVIEFNASVFKSAEAIAKKAFDNYVSNSTAAFEDAKTLVKSGDVAEFYKSASAVYTKNSEAYLGQAKELAEMSQKALKDNLDNVQKVYKDAFAA
ncbi:MAG: phasin family protein [Pseudomonadota bacterium]